MIMSMALIALVAPEAGAARARTCGLAVRLVGGLRQLAHRARDDLSALHDERPQARGHRPHPLSHSGNRGRRNGARGAIAGAAAEHAGKHTVIREMCSRRLSRTGKPATNDSGGHIMPAWTPDPSFYPSPRMAMKAAPETLAYVAAFDPDRRVPDALAVVDVDPQSANYAHIVGSVPMPNPGDELHHFGWNACSSCLCPNAPHPHTERRYLVVPGLRSSRIHILDTKPDPKNPKIIKVIEPEEVA